MEKIVKPISGFIALLGSLLLFALSVYFFVTGGMDDTPLMHLFGALSFIAAMFLSMGLIVVSPNHSRVLTFFGKYVGTVKANGLLFVNPLYAKQKMSLRSENLESSKLKVNDKLGNPIEIAAVIVWQVQNTYKAAFEVEDYDQYVKLQSESAVRHLANSCPYDHMEDENASITLRDGGEQVNDLLELELNERLAAAGIFVKEA
ncbi:MAG: SPFH domain-containing protein, partial [Chitinophagaceae bacterium]